MADKRLLTRDEQLLYTSKRLLTRDSNFYDKRLLTRDIQRLSADKRLLTRDMQLPADTHQYIRQDFNSPASTRAGFSIIVKNLQTGETKQLPSRIVSGSISRGMSKDTNWTFTFADRVSDKLMSPFNSLSEYYSWIQLTVFSAEKTLKYVWQLRVRIGGITWLSPELIPIHIERTASKDGYKTVFSGTDRTKLMLLKNQTLESKVSSSTIKHTSNSIRQAIFSACNITNYYISNASNFPVRKMHLQGGIPIDWLNELDAVGFDFWYFENSQFVVTAPNFKTNSQDWIYQDRKNIHELRRIYSVAELENKVEVKRKQDGGMPEEFIGETAGWQEVTLSQPRYGALLIFDATASKYCQIGPGTSILYYDANNILNGLPTKKVKFNIAALQDAYIDSPLNSGKLFWKVRVTGMTQEQLTDGLEFDSTFGVNITDASSIASYGLLPAPNPIENMLIPNQEWATIHGKRYLADKRRTLHTFDFRVPFNPFIKPGDTILVTEYGNDLQNIRIWVENVSHSFSPNQPSTTFNGSLYEYIP